MMDTSKCTCVDSISMVSVLGFVSYFMCFFLSKVWFWENGLVAREAVNAGFEICDLWWRSNIHLFLKKF